MAYSRPDIYIEEVSTPDTTGTPCRISKESLVE